MQPFGEIPDAASLLDSYNSKFVFDKKDHHPRYRAVGISVMCSLAALGPECSPPVYFVAGYCTKDVSFRKVLDNLLASCYIPQDRIAHLADQIIALCEKFGLDVSKYGGKPCESGNPGHLLQIFIRRYLVDQLAYASKPYGEVDEERQPLSNWLGSDSNTNFGQARIVAHPKFFMQQDNVRMHVASADVTFHRQRQFFQMELTKLLSDAFSDPGLHFTAATGVHGGTLPAWWSSYDQENHDDCKPKRCCLLSCMNNN